MLQQFLVRKCTSLTVANAKRHLRSSWLPRHPECMHIRIPMCAHVSIRTPPFNHRDTLYILAQYFYCRWRSEIATWRPLGISHLTVVSATLITNEGLRHWENSRGQTWNEKSDRYSSEKKAHSPSSPVRPLDHEASNKKSCHFWGPIMYQVSLLTFCKHPL